MRRWLTGFREIVCHTSEQSTSIRIWGSMKHMHKPSDLQAAVRRQFVIEVATCRTQCGVSMPNPSPLVLHKEILSVGEGPLGSIEMRGRSSSAG